jgi:hypothetical protein
MQACGMSRAASRVSVVILACALAGCHPHWFPGPPDGRLTLNQQRIAAMVSVHAHAELKRTRLPRGLAMMPLDDAMEFLKADLDRDYFAKSRLHRAVAKLVAYDVKRFENVILIAISPTLLQSLIASMAVTDTPSAKEMKANDALTVLDGSPFPDCRWSELSYNLNGDNPLEAVAKVSVHRQSITDLQRSLDPQNWDLCSKFWKPPERTYLAIRSGTTVTTVPPKPSDVAYTHSLYEHFQSTACGSWLVGCHTADFENMLDITTNPQTNSYHATYDFVSPSISALMDTTPVVLKHDDGYLHATPGTATNEWIVEGKKVLEFKGTVANTWAMLAFGYALKELTAEVADIACCDVRVGPTPTSAPSAPSLIEVEPIP